MKNTNQLGIWMDHSVAYLIEFTTKPYAVQTIVHKYLMEEKTAIPSKEKKSISGAKESILNSSFIEIGKAIVNYNKIVLFGPLDTKLVFFDFLSEDEQFWKLKIEIKDYIAI